MKLAEANTTQRARELSPQFEDVFGGELVGVIDYFAKIIGY